MPRRQRRPHALIIQSSAFLELSEEEKSTLSRLQAIEEICRVLQHFMNATPWMQRRIAKWIALFNIQAEELLEAGLDYETVCAFERRLML